ncbi:MAG: zinc-binding dehydrogenase [Planctomycetota bacterium]|nr:zinc-binding dehydrogenase [Planctomycetota bacterium]
MKAIRFVRSVPRWLLVRGLGGKVRGLATGALSCIELAELEPPALPAPGWVRVRPLLSGICGSDLSAIGCKGSPYFSPFTSTPFVLGHELVGVIESVDAATPSEWQPGQRVVLEPALGCAVRGIDPPCAFCAEGQYANCVNILKGSIAGGIQTGYCKSTGGGWSASLVAHPSQLHRVPESLSHEAAVLAEPFACAIHGALKAHAEPRGPVLVIGCGAIGLLTIAAYRLTGGKAKVLAVARYPHQAEMAKRLGADEICSARGYEGLYKWVLERTGGSIHQPELGKPVVLGGPPVIFDCVGSSDSIDDTLRLAAPRGLVVLVGMPGIPKNVDWTSIWYKELRVQGAYAYGWEDRPEGRRKTMALALELLEQDAKAGGALKDLVNRKHPLAAYRTALDQAFHAGTSGSFKVVFDLS